MNIGKDNRHPRYICDKCGYEIKFAYRKGFNNLNNYCKKDRHNVNYKKDFDLCGNCEKKFREWLKEKEIPTTGEMINRFSIWEEDKQ